MLAGSGAGNTPGFRYLCLPFPEGGWYVISKIQHVVDVSSFYLFFLAPYHVQLPALPHSICSDILVLPSRHCPAQHCGRLQPITRSKRFRQRVTYSTVRANPSYSVKNLLKFGGNCPLQYLRNASAPFRRPLFTKLACACCVPPIPPFHSPPLAQYTRQHPSPCRRTFQTHPLITRPRLSTNLSHTSFTHFCLTSLQQYVLQRRRRRRRV